MSTTISSLSAVDPRAQLGENVEIGPFCLIGPDVILGDGCKLDSHVTIIGNTTIGESNRFFPNCVIGGEPQDKSYRDSATRVQIGDRNVFREGVTVNRGAEKEDGCTYIGNDNLLMSNSHVAHNCIVENNIHLVNGVLLGGHVNIQNGAIVSGNTAVHHFGTVGTMAFVSGMARVVTDVPPYMMAAGADKLEIRTVNIVGMRRNGISESTIGVIKQAHKLLFRKRKKLEEARNELYQELDGIIPIELSTLFQFLEKQSAGKLGRGREVYRDVRPSDLPKPQEEPKTEGLKIRRAA